MLGLPHIEAGLHPVYEAGGKSQTLNAFLLMVQAVELFLEGVMDSLNCREVLRFLRLESVGNRMKNNLCSFLWWAGGALGSKDCLRGREGHEVISGSV